MKPTIFPEANGSLLGGPGVQFGTADTVADLPVYRGHGQVISCWRLSWSERLRVLFTGRVWLLVWTDKSHYPVCLRGATPFERIA